MGAILGYDALCQGQGPSSAASSQGSMNDIAEPSPVSVSSYRSLTTPSSTGFETDHGLVEKTRHSSLSNDFQESEERDGSGLMRSHSEMAPGGTLSKRHSMPMFFGKEVTFAEGAYNSNFDDELNGDGDNRTVDSLYMDAANTTSPRVDFEVTYFFTFGSPLGIVLAQRKTLKEDYTGKALCMQEYVTHSNKTRNKCYFS